MEIALNRGNWVPISKALVKKLPTDREFSEVEAMFSLTVNYDCVSPVSVSGLATRWMWSRKRVDNFLKKLGVTIEYEDKFDRHKRGQVGYQVGNRRGTGGEQVEFIDSRYLPATRNRRGTGGEQVGNRKGSTIKEPNPNPKPKPKDKEEKNAHGSFENVLLTERELEKLNTKFNGTVNEKIENLSIGIESKGYKYKSHYATILSWARRDEKTDGNGTKKTFQTKHDINDQIQNIGAAINERTGFNPYAILEAGDSSGDVDQDRCALPE